LTVRRNSAEGGTDETTMSLANSGGASGDPFDNRAQATGCTIKFDTEQAAHGKFSYRLDTDASGANLTVAWYQASVGVLTDHFGRIYFRPSRNFGTDVAFEEIVEVDTAGGVVDAQLGFDASNHLILRDASLTTKATGAVACSIGAWNRLEWHVIHSATVGVMEARLFVGANWDGHEPDEFLSATGLNTGASGGQFYFGAIYANAFNQKIWFDDYVAGATTWVGPVRDAPFQARRMPMGV
jgi:hypothetical protein